MTSLEKKTDIQNDISGNDGNGTERETHEIESNNSSESKIKRIT